MKKCYLFLSLSSLLTLAACGASMGGFFGDGGGSSYPVQSYDRHYNGGAASYHSGGGYSTNQGGPVSSGQGTYPMTHPQSGGSSASGGGNYNVNNPPPLSHGSYGNGSRGGNGGNGSSRDISSFEQNVIKGRHNPSTKPN